MDIQAEKIWLLQTIINTRDEGLISDIKTYLSGRKNDWFDELSVQQKEDIQEGLDDADNHNLLSHEEVVKRFEKWGLK